MSLNILVLGSNSEIAQSFLETLINNQEPVKKIYFASSNAEFINKYITHLQIKYNLKNVEMFVVPLNLLSDDVTASLEPLKDVNLLISAIGLLGLNSEKGLFNLKNTQDVIAINYSKLIEAINIVVENMLHSKAKSDIIVLSSVAGERGRQSNFIYGSAKAGLTAYLSGLRNFLSSTNIHVMTVLPGFMQTKMTEGMNLNPKLTIDPPTAGKLIYKAYKSKKNILYIKGIWKYIMLIIKIIPEFIFKKLKL